MLSLFLKGYYMIDEVLGTDVIVRLQKGEEGAFELFLLHFEKRIFAFLFSLVRHKEDAQDLTQETFIRVYKNRRSLDGARNVKSWVYTIAMHVAYDWFRKKKNSKELFLLDDDSRPFETIDERDAYSILESADQVDRALEKIKPSYKAILLLYYYQSFSYDEIAAILSLPLNTVKTNMRRAKQCLAEEIEKDGNEKR